MYSNMKHLGLTLIQWRDEVFHGEWSLGEIYRMVQAGVDLEALSETSK